MAEHTNPNHNSIDIVKLLYIHAYRVGALKKPSFSDSLIRHEPFKWSHPEWRVIPRLAYPSGEVLPGERAESRQGTRSWQNAVLSANIQVPSLNWETVEPFLVSSLPDHCLPADWSNVEPPMTSEPREFTSLLSEITVGIPPSEHGKMRQIWVDRLSAYHKCPHECGHTSGRSNEMNRHITVCPYQTEESRLLHDQKEAERTKPCPHCDRRFREKKYLDKHIREVHQQHEPFSCPVPGCDTGQQFTTPDSFKHHWDSSHVWPRLKCPICGVVSSSLSGHLTHMHRLLTREERAPFLQKARVGVEKKAGSYGHHKAKVNPQPIPPLLIPKARPWRRRTKEHELAGSKYAV